MQYRSKLYEIVCSVILYRNEIVDYTPLWYFSFLFVLFYFTRHLTSRRCVMKMINCFLNFTLGSLELHFCIFQMGFWWSVCVAFSLLFSAFNNRKSETIYGTKTRQSKNRMYSLCNSFSFSKSPFPEIHQEKYDRLTILLRSKSLKKSNKTWKSIHT